MDVDGLVWTCELPTNQTIILWVIWSTIFEHVWSRHRCVRIGVLGPGSRRTDGVFHQGGRIFPKPDFKGPMGPWILWRAWRPWRPCEASDLSCHDRPKAFDPNFGTCKNGILGNPWNYSQADATPAPEVQHQFHFRYDRRRDQGLEGLVTWKKTQHMAGLTGKTMMSRGIFGVLDFEMKTNDCHPGTGRCRTVPQWCLDRFYSLRYTFQIQDLVSPEGRFYRHCRHISTYESSFLLRSLYVSVLPWL